MLYVGKFNRRIYFLNYIFKFVLNGFLLLNFWLLCLYFALFWLLCHFLLLRHSLGRLRLSLCLYGLIFRFWFLFNRLLCFFFNYLVKVVLYILLAFKLFKLVFRCFINSVNNALLRLFVNRKIVNLRKPILFDKFLLWCRF